MSAPEFVHDDLVKLANGQIGKVKEVHQAEDMYVYRVQLCDHPTEQLDVPEAGLELVKIANDDETGFAIRYIT